MKRRYFAFKYFEERHVLAMADGPWVTFFDRFVKVLDESSLALDASASTLFLMYLPDISVLGIITDCSPVDVPLDVAQSLIFFDEKTASFRAQSESDEREATWPESLRYCEVHASSGLSIDALRLRILEMSYGFIPSFQYRVEHVYRSHFKQLVADLNQDDEPFQGKGRKEEFSNLFKSLTLPSLSKHGFERDTPRAMRLVKRSEELSVFIDFSHISFGSGAYQVSVIWMDGPDSPFDDERLLGRLEPWFPYHSNLVIESHNPQVLAYSVKEWLRVFELYVLEYISNYRTLDEVRTWLEKDRSLCADKVRVDLPPRSPHHAYTLSTSAASLKRLNMDR